MVWFRVDDRFHTSRKVLSIPRALRLPAIGLWTIAGTWSASEELDGAVPDYMVDEWGGTPELVGALVAAGLWERVDGGARFHKWEEYQPTRAQLESKREAERVRKAEWRDKKSRAESQRRPAGTPAGRGMDGLIPPGAGTAPKPAAPPAAPLSPFCPKHTPGGPNGQSCRACGDAKMAYTLAGSAAKAKPTSEPFTVAPGSLCLNGEHTILPDGTCTRCEYRGEAA